jgi:hypothetical protein
MDWPVDGKSLLIRGSQTVRTGETQFTILMLPPARPYHLDFQTGRASGQILTGWQVSRLQRTPADNPLNSDTLDPYRWNRRTSALSAIPEPI